MLTLLQGRQTGINFPRPRQAVAFRASRVSRAAFYELSGC